MPTRSARPALLGGLLCLCAAAPATAREKVVVYRCTDASGAVTLQNDIPCPKGSRQERRVVEAAPAAVPRRAVPSPAPAPAPAPAEPLAAPPTATPPPVPPPPPARAYPYTLGEAPPIAEGERLPPPSLYVCRTFDDRSYLAESRGPHERCVTVSTSGVGGGLLEAGPGVPCEKRIDECVRVPDDTLCDGWRQRLREAESALGFASAENRAQAQAEVIRIGRVVRYSTCGSEGAY